MATKKEVAAVSQSTELATFDADELALLQHDAGIDVVEQQDVTLPFISVLQALSPQVNKRDSAYIEGAEQGMFYNSATDEVFDGDAGLLVIPILYQRRYTEWTPRNSGGGLVRDWGTDTLVLERITHRDETSGRDMTADGTEIVTSAMFYVFILNAGKVSRGVFSWSGTQFKKGKKWNALIQDVQIRRADNKGFMTPAMYYGTYRVTSVPESNDQGNWFGVRVKPEGYTLKLSGEYDGKELYLRARDFRQQIESGLVKAPAAPTAGTASDENIPF